MTPPTIPQAVIDKDHELEGRTERAEGALAKFRWQQILDPAGPQHPFKTYARDVGRSLPLIKRYARGYALWLERGGNAALPLNDAIRLAEQTEEQQQFSEAIAEGSGGRIPRLNHPTTGRAGRDIVDQAKKRAERRGTDPVEEARTIAQEQVRIRQADHRRAAERRSRRSVRYVEIEGDLATAQRRLTHALTVAQGVDFNDDELELIRDSIAKVRAVLDLIDLRMAGAPDIDWDGELRKLAAP